MNIEQLNQIRELVQWIKETTNKSANFEMSFWGFSHHEQRNEVIDYRLWADGLFTIRGNDVSEILEKMDDIKTFCQLHEELAA